MSVEATNPGCHRAVIPPAAVNLVFFLAIPTAGVRPQAEGVESGGVHPDTLERFPSQKHQPHKGDRCRQILRGGYGMTGLVREAKE